MMAHIIMAHNKFFWGEAHERFQRLRVFHAQPLSSFSCYSFKEIYAGCGAQLLLKEGQNWPEKQFSTKILFFKIFSKYFGTRYQDILVPGTKFWYPVPIFWYPVPKKFWYPLRPPPVMHTNLISVKTLRIPTTENSRRFGFDQRQ